MKTIILDMEIKDRLKQEALLNELTYASNILERGKFNELVLNSMQDVRVLSELMMLMHLKNSLKHPNRFEALPNFEDDDMDEYNDFQMDIYSPFFKAICQTYQLPFPDFAFKNWDNIDD